MRCGTVSVLSVIKEPLLEFRFGSVAVWRCLATMRMAVTLSITDHLAAHRINMR